MKRKQLLKAKRANEAWAKVGTPYTQQELIDKSKKTISSYPSKDYKLTIDQEYQQIINPINFG